MATPTPEPGLPTEPLYEFDDVRGRVHQLTRGQVRACVINCPLDLLDLRPASIASSDLVAELRSEVAIEGRR